MIDYTVVTADTPDMLDAKVNDLIVDGWTPQGGVSVSESNYYSEDAQGFFKDNFHQTFAQAMIIKSK